MLLSQKYLANKTVGLLSSDERSGLSDILSNGWWSTLDNRYANKDMISNFTPSFSNIIGRSGLSSHGIKPIYNFISFSVGTAAPENDSYITKDCNETVPTATIKDGFLIFSIPQTHYYFGVGDIVVLEGGINVYINHKITCAIWMVHNGAGLIPDDCVDLEVIRIDKAYPSLYDAFSATGMIDVVGTSTLTRSLRVLCYEMDDDVGDIDPSTVFSTSKDCKIKIYTPFNTKTDCNKSQRHQGNSNSGYITRKTIQTNYYTEVEGLIFKKTGSGGSAIIIYLAGIASCNIITGSWAIGVEFSEGSLLGVAEVSNNYFNGNAIGLKCKIDSAVSYCHLYNNTFHDCTKSISYNTTVPIIMNCLMQGGATCLDDNAAGLSNVSYCITEDDTCDGASNSYPEVVVQLTNTAIDDLRAKFVDFVTVGVGGDVSVVNDIDIAGNYLDNTFCIGAYHETKSVIFSVGLTTDDLKTGSPTAIVTGGSITFSLDQTNEYICAGCLVGIIDVVLILKKKISNTVWEVVNTDGTPFVDDIAPNNVNAIRYTHGDIFDAVASIDLYDLIEDDVKILINCSVGVSNRCIEIDANTDRVRNITIQAPILDCNSIRRHNGTWNDDLFIHYGEEGGEKSMRVLCPYVIIDGLQMRGGHHGIFVEKAGMLVQNNIIRDCGGNGVTLSSNHGENNNHVVNNLIYDCFGNGIEFEEDVGKPTISIFTDLVVRFIENGDKNHDYEVCINGENTGVDYPTITWLPERLEILYDWNVYPTLDDVINNAKVYGEPWATLSYYGTEIGNVDTNILSNNNFVSGNYGYEDNYLDIYNNTVYRCKNGIVVWSNPNNRFFNKCLLKNNIVKECVVDGYVNHSPKSPWITADCCIDDDGTLNKFVGYSNYTFYDFDFENGFYINLYETLRVNALDLMADPNFSFDYDSTGYVRSTVMWSPGFVNYNPLRNGKIVHYSIGSGGLLCGPGILTLTIKNGIATFVGDVDPRIGVGDLVAYDIHVAGLCEKGSDNKWLVTEWAGDPLQDVDTPTGVLSISRACASSNSIATSGAGSIGVLLGSADLVAVQCGLALWFYNDDEYEDQKITISGWVTDANYNIKLSTPYNTKTQCITRQRHLGYYGGVIFNHEGTGEIVNISDDYITIEGLVLNKDLHDADNVLVNGANTGCVIKCNVIAGGEVGINLDGDNLAVSNIIYNQNSAGISLNNGSKAYNDTCINCGQYSFLSNHVDDEIINCIGFGASVVDFSGPGQFINCSPRLSNEA